MCAKYYKQFIRYDIMKCQDKTLKILNKYYLIFNNNKYLPIIESRIETLLNNVHN